MGARHSPPLHITPSKKNLQDKVLDREPNGVVHALTFSYGNRGYTCISCSHAIKYGAHPPRLSHKELACISDTKDQTIALNVRLKPSEPSAHPRATNYTNVGVAQGIAYIDFGFIEPTLLAAVAKTAKDGQAAPKGLDGTLVTRVAMGLDVLARLHQQIQ